MTMLDSLKTRAVNAVTQDNRLIADVSLEFGISRRKLFAWLKESDKKSINKVVSRQNKSTSPALLKSQIKTLQTEVTLLKDELKQYQITERLIDGRIILDFNKNKGSNQPLQKAG
jgi:transposase-like protein